MDGRMDEWIANLLLFTAGRQSVSSDILCL